MTLRLGDDAPDFTADTTEGEISFLDWKGDSWAVLFSHPADYTPVCTTELGRVAGLKPEFDKRNVKVLALSVDPIEEHHGWAPDIGVPTGVSTEDAKKSFENVEELKPYLRYADAPKG